MKMMHKVVPNLIYVHKHPPIHVHGNIQPRIDLRAFHKLEGCFQSPLHLYTLALKMETFSL
jgi:hypothetical protein